MIDNATVQDSEVTSDAIEMDKDVADENAMQRLLLLVLDTEV